MSEFQSLRAFFYSFMYLEKFQKYRFNRYFALRQVLIYPYFNFILGYPVFCLLIQANTFYMSPGAENTNILKARYFNTLLFKKAAWHLSQLVISHEFFNFALVLHVALN